MDNHERSPQLPPGICDNIIDHLHEDYHAIAICGLVCRAWRPRTRFNLFNSVVITQPSAYELFASILEASPAIAGLVRSIYLGRPFVYHGYDEEDRDGSEIPPYHRYLHFLHKLHEIRELTLANWNAFDLSDLNGFPPSLPKLKLLFLMSVEVEEYDFLRLLRASPKISDLRLCDVDVHGADSAIQLRSLASPVALLDQAIRIERMIYAHSSSVSRMAPILKKTPMLLHMKKLQLACQPSAEGSVENAQLFLQEAGGSLEQLDIAAVQRNSRDPWAKEMSFEYNPRLRSLRLEDITLTIPELGGSIPALYMTKALKLDWMTLLLKQIRPLHTELQRVQIILRMFDWDDWDGWDDYTSRLDWTEIDPALAILVVEHPQVEIDIYVRRTKEEEMEEWVDETVDMILERLPQLMKKKCYLNIVCSQKWAADSGGMGGCIQGPSRKFQFVGPSIEDGDDSGYLNDSTDSEDSAESVDTNNSTESDGSTESIN